MASVINNGIPLVNGMLCSWADVVVLIGGVPVTGILGVEYGDSQEVVNKYGADTHVGYFKRPDFDTIKAVTKVSKVDEVEAGKIMFDKCWLGGSEELRADAILFMAVQKQLGQMLNSCMGSLKNL